MNFIKFKLKTTILNSLEEQKQVGFLECGIGTKYPLLGQSPILYCSCRFETTADSTFTSL